MAGFRDPYATAPVMRAPLGGAGTGKGGNIIQPTPPQPDPQVEADRLYNEGAGVGTARSIWNGETWVSPDQANYDLAKTGSSGAGGATSSRSSGSTALRLPSLPPPVPPGGDRSRMDEALSSLKSMFSGAGDPAPVTTPPGSQQAQDLAYARAKEKMGAHRLAAVQSFQNQMAGRGLAGSTGPGFESDGVADIIAGGATDLNNFVAGQATADVNRTRQIEDRNFQAADRRKQFAMSALADFYTRMGFAG